MDFFVSRDKDISSGNCKYLTHSHTILAISTQRVIMWPKLESVEAQVRGHIILLADILRFF